jgi:hypothetical protein
MWRVHFEYASTSAPVPEVMSLFILFVFLTTYCMLQSRLQYVCVFEELFCMHAIHTKQFFKYILTLVLTSAPYFLSTFLTCSIISYLIMCSL